MKPTTFLLALCIFGPVLGSSTTRADEFGELRSAIEADNVRVVRKFIESGKATPDTRVMAPGVSEPGIPLLGLAAREGSVAVSQYLIAAHADVNLRSPSKETPLMLAALFDDATPEGDFNTSYVKHEKIVHLLVEAGADLENPESYTPLTYSAFYRHLRITRFLLDRGASVNGDAADGRTRVPTALMIAALNGDRSTIQLLLERGADPCIRDGWDHDAAFMAKRNEHFDVVPLVECKAQ